MRFSISMCGRFSNQIDDPGLWEEFLIGWPFECDTGYNMAPSCNIPVLTYDRQNKIPAGQPMQWGLVPSWSKGIKPKFSTFNARSETLAEKPAFRSAWKQSRTCLIPIKGYYEWQKEDSGKQPYYIHLSDDEPIMLAGIWDTWSKGRNSLYSCTIITRSSMGDLTRIHSRMPMRVNRDHAFDWLKNGKDWLHIISNRQHPEDYDFYRVSKKMNQPVNQGPDLINPRQGAHGS